MILFAATSEHKFEALKTVTKNEIKLNQKVKIKNEIKYQMHVCVCPFYCFVFYSNKEITTIPMSKIYYPNRSRLNVMHKLSINTGMRYGACGLIMLVFEKDVKYAFSDFICLILLRI